MVSWQVSGMSHAPSDSRHTVPGSAARIGVHVGEPSSPHSISPTSHGLPVSHDPPGVQAPQVCPKQKPVVHSVPNGTAASAGHTGEDPSHVSSASHSPAAARHTVSALRGVRTQTGSPLSHETSAVSHAPSASHSIDVGSHVPPSLPPSSTPASVPPSTSSPGRGSSSGGILGTSRQRPCSQVRSSGQVTSRHAPPGMNTRSTRVSRAT